MSYGRQYRANRARILAASQVCHVCGHDGADGADHIIAKARGGDDSMGNLAPVHHSQPCTTCHHWCNLAKGSKAWAPIIRRSGSLNPVE